MALPTAAAPAQLSLSPSNPRIAQGTAQQFTVGGQYPTGPVRDLTQTVHFTVSDPEGSRLPMAADGLLLLEQPGRYQVTAEYKGSTVTTGITVTAATLKSLSLSPIAPQVAKGLSLPFTATAVFSDGSTQDVTSASAWSEKDLAGSGVALLSSKGIATAKNVGQASITARYKTVSASTTLKVTAVTLTALTLSPPHPSLAIGSTQTFHAQGTFSDGTLQDVTDAADWAVMDLVGSGVASIAGSTAVAESAGTATVSVFYLGLQADTTLTVNAVTLTSLAVSPLNPSLKKGATQPFTATGRYSDGTTHDLTAMVSWTATDIAPALGVAMIDARGLATGTQAGQATITASFLGLSASTPLTITAALLASIAVTPTSPAIAKGTPLQFIARGTYTDGSTQDITPLVTWASVFSTVASVSNAAGSQGLATGVRVGATTVSATLAGLTGSTSLTVTAAALLSIAVTPTNPTIAKGPPLQFTATGTYTDGVTQNLTSLVTWACSNTTVATISNATGTQGLATEVGVGSTTISATMAGMTASSTLLVTAATLVSVSVTPANSNLDKGATKQYSATGTYTDGSTRNLTTLVNWTSSDGAVAIISNDAGTQGLATGVGFGTTTISASPGGLIGSTTLTVSWQSFQAGTTFSTGTDTYPTCVAVADFNGDGWPDLVTANSRERGSWGKTVSVLLGNGAGGFGAATSFTADYYPAFVAVGDFNRDGKPDLATANNGSSTVSVLLGNGAGGFGAATNYSIGVGNNPISVAVGDFNGDGWPDLVAGNYGDYMNGTISVLLGQGGGKFGTVVKFKVPGGVQSESVAVGDFDGDGKLDLVIGSMGSGKVSVLHGYGDGTFSTGTAFNAGSPSTVVVGDVNGDGKLDLVVPGSTSANVLLGDGTGNFNAPTSFAVGSQPYSVTIGDFNGDGKPDLATANAWSNSISVLLGNGTGGFVSAANISVGQNPHFIAVGDFNLDGRPDLAINNESDSTVTVLIHQ